MQAASNAGSSLCIGIPLSPFPAGPSLAVQTLQMMPCNGINGYVVWRQTTPSGYITVFHSGCSGPNPPRECYFGICALAPPSRNISSLIDTRIDMRFLLAKTILLLGRANYVVEEVAPGEWTKIRARETPKTGKMVCRRGSTVSVLHCFNCIATDMHLHSTAAAGPRYPSGMHGSSISNRV